MTHTPNILIVATSAATMNSSSRPTGVWLEELTTPWYAFRDAGATVTLASIAGGAIPIDPNSLKPAGENEASVERYLTDEAFQRQVADTPCFETLDANTFDALFLPGGHGTMFDYPAHTALADLITRLQVAGKVIAAVCHGPAGLVSARKADGSPLVAGRRVTAFSDSEERAIGLDQAVPFLLEQRLQQLGAHYESAPDFAPHAVRDGNLITGQNPASAEPTAVLVMEALTQSLYDSREKP